MRPDHPALEAPGMALDHRALDAAVNRVARVLRDAGVRPGMLTALCLGDRPLHLLALWALARLGAPVLPMDHRWAPAERHAARAAFACARSLVEPRCADHLPGEIIADAGFEQAVADAPATPTPAPADPDPPMLVALSSGTTGRPKGPLIRQSHMQARFVGHYVGLGFDRGDRFLVATPLHHGGGRGFAMSMLWAGATLRLFCPPWEPEGLDAALAAFGATATFLVPTQLRRCLAAGTPGAAPRWPGLRALVSTGAALAPAERQEVRARLSPRLYDYYGSTEGGGATVLAPEEMAAHGDSVGRAGFGIELQVVDAADAPLPPGVEGAIRWRGPGVPQAVPGDPAFREGWFRPGDRGVLDDGGWLRITGREGEMIIRGGANIHPSEVEAALLAIPGVAEAAVLGLPDAEFGQEIAAAVVAPGLGEAALQQALAVRLAPYKQPRRWLLLPTLPRNAGGKVVKAALRPLFDGGAAE
jgi:acyl-coenzyme A synthetase/AMP-(fatty) acid ligase